MNALTPSPGKLDLPIGNQRAPLKFKLGLGLDFPDYSAAATVDLMMQQRGYALPDQGGAPEAHPAKLGASGLPTGPSECVLFHRTDMLKGTYHVRVVSATKPEFHRFTHGWVRSEFKEQGRHVGVPMWRATIEREPISAPTSNLVGLVFTSPLAEHPRVTPDSLGLDAVPQDFLRSECVDHYKQAHELRFMDVTHVNDNMEQSWSQRTSDDMPGGKVKSWRWCFRAALAIANAQGSRVKALRFHMPVRAHLDYYEQWATMAVRELLPKLPVDVEIRMVLGNENWNGQFQQFHSLLAEANDKQSRYHDAVHVKSANNAWPSQYELFANLWGLKTALLGRVARQAFGARGRTILESQAYNPAWMEDHILPYLRRPDVVATFGDPRSYLASLSVGGYISGNEEEMAAAKSVEAFDAVMRQGEYAFANPKWVANMTRCVKIGAAHGLPVDLYEFGFHTHQQVNTEVKLAWHRSPLARRMVVDLVDTHRRMGIESGVWFLGSAQTFDAKNVNSFAWPIREHFTDQSPKMMGWMDAQAKHGV